jgi:hypothetical protein
MEAIKEHGFAQREYVLSIIVFSVSRRVHILYITALTGSFECS